MVAVVYWLLTRDEWLGPEVGGHWQFLQSQREPGELLQCSKYVDSTIYSPGIVVIITSVINQLKSLFPAIIASLHSSVCDTHD